MLLKKKFSLFFNSDPASGSTNQSSDLSSFSVTLSQPISIPKTAIDCRMYLMQANVWWTIPNISASFGNNDFSFITGGNPYSFTIPDGLYSIADLNNFLGSQFANLGFSSSLILIGANYATSQSTLIFQNAADQVDFTTLNSVRTILGFDAGLITSTIAGFTAYSQNPAQFNRVSSLLITSSMLSVGLPVNQFGLGIIGSIPINVAPGSQIQYSPSSNIAIDAKELIGSSKINFRFNLVDQNLRPAPTGGEFFNFTVMFEYTDMIR